MRKHEIEYAEYLEEKEAMKSKTQSKSIKRSFSYLKNQATIENCFVVKERKNDIKKGSNAYNKAAHAIASAFAANSLPFF